MGALPSWTQAGAVVQVGGGSAAVRAALEELIDELSPELRRGVGLVARLVNEVTYHSPVVTPSKVLVFDNGRMLHRGPHLEESSGRELIRIKVAGKAIV